MISGGILILSIKIIVYAIIIGVLIMYLLRIATVVKQKLNIKQIKYVKGEGFKVIRINP